jgi:hypothetical protein
MCSTSIDLLEKLIEGDLFTAEKFGCNWQQRVTKTHFYSQNLKPICIIFLICVTVN